jgi:hypothetical protein
MVGVFFMSETLVVPGVADQSIHLFDTEADAQNFIFDKLVEAGEIEIDDSQFVFGDQRFVSREDAVDAVQGSLGMMEYFHAYEAIDHRNVPSA